MFLYDGRFRAIGNTCNHKGGPLSEGRLRGEFVMCPWHAWEWNCATGENDMDPAKKVATCEVKLEGGDILLNVS